MFYLAQKSAVPYLPNVAHLSAPLVELCKWNEVFDGITFWLGCMCLQLIDVHLHNSHM